MRRITPTTNGTQKTSDNEEAKPSFGYFCEVEKKSGD